MLLNSFLLSINAIASIFVMMAVGYGAKRLLLFQMEQPLGSVADHHHKKDGGNRVQGK